MSGQYELSASAHDDLREIWRYIGIENGNPAAADRLWADIAKACEKVSKRPSLGHARRELTSDSRVLFYCVREFYLVIYRKDTDPLYIARVLHGARDVEKELRER